MNNEVEIRGNTGELLKLFDEMQKTFQKKVVVRAGRTAGKILLDDVRRRLDSLKKGYSKDNFKTIKKSFRIKALKKDLGVSIGSGYFKARWLETGTKERYTRKKGKSYRGKIQKGGYFDEAVKTRGDEVTSVFQEELIKEIDKIVDKYSK